MFIFIMFVLFAPDSSFLGPASLICCFLLLFFVLAATENSSASLDDYLTALFYKAVLLRLMRKWHEAKQTFENVLEL